MNIITREQWGARHPDGVQRNGRPITRPVPVREAWLHHSVTVAPDLVPPFGDDYAAVRTLERIGQARFKAGISYTFAITPTGLTFEGHSIEHRGAHTYGHNDAALAVVLVGDYSTRKPTAAQIESAARLLVWLHRSGKLDQHHFNGGHRDASGNSTSCPGNGAHAMIGAINRRAEQLWNGTTDEPGKPSTSPVRVLRLGSTGADVKALQAGMRRVFPSYAGRLELDGSYGPATSAAVREFQRRAKADKRYSSTIDGTAGPATLAALRTYGIEIAA